MKSSRAAALSMMFAYASLAIFAAGPLLAQLEWAGPFVAFRIMGLGLLLGLFAICFGIVGIWQTRGEDGRAQRPRAIIGTLSGLLPLLITLGAAGSARDVPMINDITTDTLNPPRFIAAPTDAANSGRDLDYPGEEFASQQRSGYPDIEPIEVPGSPDAVFERCVEAAEKLGWNLTLRDAAAGRFEAVAVSRIFHFVDDIVVRVQRNGADSVVDVRSKSRDGRSDMGANAARIRLFRDELVD